MRLKQAFGERAFDSGPWQAWFAWRPVRLFGSSRIAWGQHIYRRSVRRDFAKPLVDYSDDPDRFPSGASDPLRWI